MFISIHQVVSGTAQMIVEYFKRLSAVYFKPRRFFLDIKHEAGLGKPFVFIILTFLFSELIKIDNYVLFRLFFAETCLGIIYKFIEILVAIFISAFTFHLLARLFGQKNPFYQSFKIFAYLTGYRYFFVMIGNLLYSVEYYSVCRIPAFLVFESLTILLSFWVVVVFISAQKLYTNLKWPKFLILLIVYFLLTAIVLIVFMFLGFSLRVICAHIIGISILL